MDLFKSLSFVVLIQVFSFASAVIAQTSTIVFHSATIIAFDEALSQLSVLRNASILIQNDRIAGLSENSVPNGLPNSTQYIDATGKIISPGFINTHHHLWQTAFKTLGSNTTLAEYVQRYSEVRLSPL